MLLLIQEGDRKASPRGNTKRGVKSETSTEGLLVVKRGRVSEGLLLSLAEIGKRWGVVSVSYRLMLQPRLCPTDIAGED